MASHKHHKENQASNFAQAAAGQAEDPAANATGQASESGASSDISAPGKESQADQLQRALAEKQELMNTLVRRQADFENYRKRLEKERNQDRHRGVELLVEQLLPVLDAFDRALAGQDSDANAEYRKGFEMIRTQLWSALKKQGVERVEAVGAAFDPNLHHAIESVENTAQPEGVVVGELQPGYTFQGRVLRPAMVRVSASSSN